MAAKSVKYNEKKQYAEILFIVSGYTQKQIAEELSVTEKTIGQWVEKFGWKEKKAVQNLSPTKLIQSYYEQSDLILKKAKEDDRPITSKEADSLNKIASAIEKLDKKISPSLNMEVFMRFNNFLQSIDLDLTKQLIPFQKEYIQTLIRRTQ
jgi:transposase